MNSHKTDIQTLAQLALLLTALQALPAYVVASDQRYPVASVSSSENQTMPRLIIGITIDQLRTDYLDILQNRFGQGGFRRLMQEGRVYDQVTFELDHPDATAAIAVLATGSYPFQNGISGEFSFDPETLRRRPIFFDVKYIGNSTDGYWSPRALLSSTIADELKLASMQNSKIYSIAPNAHEALITAGHSSDGAFWVDDKRGNWCSTTYYTDFPSYVTNLNNNRPLFCDPESKGWDSQLLTQNGVCALSPYQPCNPYFSHKFQESKQVMYSWIKTSPVINEAVSKMAQLFINNGRVGTAEKRTDMLQLTFYAGTYQHVAKEVYPCELEETYLRLDQTLEELLNFIDKQVGLKNTLIYVMGTGDTRKDTDEILGLSLGEFNANRCTALLNIQLNSLYGQGQWIEGFEDNQIYLNHKLIEQKQLQLDDVAREAAKFVALFSGVDEVFTAQQLLHEDYSQRIERIRNSYRKNGGGDLVIILQPGWNLRLDDNSRPQPQKRFDVYPGPAIIFAPSLVKAERIHAPVEATTIAPTVAKIIRIRAPSACRALPLF